MPGKKKSVFTLPVVLGLVGAVAMAVISSVLGIVLTQQSVAQMRETVTNKALELSSTAAALLDGDSLKGLQPSDVGSEKYQKAYDTMKAFKMTNEGTSGELAFIYACRERPDHTFEFTIDPSSDPAEFGEDLDWTYALGEAAQGRSAFDDVPFTDRWGTFYSAYSPVFDSNHEITMIVGIDIWADWYNNMLWSNSRHITIASLVAAVAGLAIGIGLSLNIRRKFRVLSSEFDQLQEDVSTLLVEVKGPMGTTSGEKGSGDFNELRAKIQNTQKEIKDYIVFTKRMAFVDSLTKLGNRASYLERIRLLEELPSFPILLLDINGLKYINDHFGHETGDEAIRVAANLLRQSFDKDDIFRIGGDEFVVLPIDGDEERVKAGMALLDQAVADYNAGPDKKLPVEFSFSKGYTVFVKGVDENYPVGFNRADSNMYADKKAFYAKHPKLNAYRL